MTEQVVKSPCINICELAENNICTGCYRSLQEIASWSYATDEQRLEIIAIARQRKLEPGNG